MAAPMLYREPGHTQPLASFFNNALFSDVSVVLPDARVVSVHQVVLACCPVLARLLAGGNLTNHHIPLTGADADALHTVLRFLYTGEAELAPNTVINLYDAANKLELSGLGSGALQYLSCVLQPATFPSLLEQAIICNQQAVLDALFTFFDTRSQEVLAHSAFQRLTEAGVAKVLAHVGSRRVTNMQELLDVANAWCAGNPLRLNDAQRLMAAQLASAPQQGVLLPLQPGGQRPQSGGFLTLAADSQLGSGWAASNTTAGAQLLPGQHVVTIPGGQSAQPEVQLTVLPNGQTIQVISSASQPTSKLPGGGNLTSQGADKGTWVGAGNEVMVLKRTSENGSGGWGGQGTGVVGDRGSGEGLTGGTPGRGSGGVSDGEPEALDLHVRPVLLKKPATATAANHGPADMGCNAPPCVPSSTALTKEGRIGHKLNTCSIEGCGADLSHLREYHQRFRICDYHLKVPSLMRDGVLQRFCQQCGRFHDLSEFDGMKRSCRARLERHNARRRKRGDTSQEDPQAALRQGTQVNSVPPHSLQIMSSAMLQAQGQDSPQHQQGYGAGMGPRGDNNRRWEALTEYAFRREEDPTCAGGQVMALVDGEAHAKRHRSHSEPGRSMSSHSGASEPPNGPLITLGSTPSVGTRSGSPVHATLPPMDVPAVAPVTLPTTAAPAPSGPVVMTVDGTVLDPASMAGRVIIVQMSGDGSAPTEGATLDLRHCENRQQQQQQQQQELPVSKVMFVQTLDTPAINLGQDAVPA